MHAGRNIALIGALQGDFRLNFFNAALMKDPEGLLERQGPNTQHPDSIRFTATEQVEERASAIHAYLLEAMAYADAGIRPPKVVQALELLNGPEFAAKVYKGDFVDNAATQAKLEQIADDLYWSAFGRAPSDAERQELWRVRRELSYSLKMVAGLKFNHDVVVPKARIPALFALVWRIAAEHRLRIPCFGHAGDGNIHVNIMVDTNDPVTNARVRATEQALFEGVVALEGSVTGEHGIGFSKAKYLPLEITPETIAVMRAVKQAFDPRGLLNPGKIFRSISRTGGES